MNKDFMTAEEMYNQAKQNEKAAFSARWDAVKLTIRDALICAAISGKYEADVVSISIDEEQDFRFVDFIVDKLEKAGYEVTTRVSRFLAKIHISCERRKG